MENTYTLDKEVMSLLNRQMNIELQNERVYKQFAMLLDVANWVGTTKWMSKASDEERGHAKMFEDWIITNFGTPTVEQLPAVMVSQDEYDGEDLLAFWKAALQLEHENTLRLNELSKTAFEAEEYPTFDFLAWFRKDQIEGEREIADIITSLKRMTKGEMVLWDGQLGD